MAAITSIRRLPPYYHSLPPIPIEAAGAPPRPGPFLPLVPANNYVPKAYPQNVAIVLLAVALHGAVLAWLIGARPAETLNPAPLPITVQWVAPPAAPPSAQPSSVAPVQETPPPAPVPAPAPKPAPAPIKPKPVTPPVKRAAAKPVTKPSEPAPVVARSTPAPSPAPTPVPALMQAVQHSSAPVGRAGYLNNPPPTYPAAAARRHQEGTTVLRVHVQPNGRPDVVEVFKSSGVPSLDDAAKTAVMKWTFMPAKRGDTPVEGWVNVPLDFKLAP